MKKLYIAASLLIVFALAFGFKTSFVNKSNTTDQMSALSLRTTQSSLFSTTRTGKDTAAEPLTMLIFGTCLAGAATLGRRHHK
jgi:hypothetical protein